MLNNQVLVKIVVILIMAKPKKIQLILLVFSIISLVLLVGIQINWIVRTARIQEIQFNHTVALAMDRIVESLSNNDVICQEVSNCLTEGNAHSCARMLRNRLMFAGIDTLIRNELNYYNIDLAYEFDIVDKGTVMTCPSNKEIFLGADLEDALALSGYELRIKFPEKVDFIKAQMGYVFISSIALLVLVHVSFFLIYRYYKREKKLTGNIIDFVNNITHELKTPLTNIALANSMISKNESIMHNQKLVSYANVIRHEHQRMKHKVDILLKASLLENEKPLQLAPFDAADEISDVANAYAVQVHNNNGHIDIQKEGDTFQVCGHKDMFQISIGNLIDNAIRYNERPPHIRINIYAEGKLLRIDIADNGIGIQKKYISRVFDKHFRIPTGDIHNNDGFGLGLFFAENTIKRMGGKISLSSKPGEGTVFTIKLPLVCQ